MYNILIVCYIGEWLKDKGFNMKKVAIIGASSLTGQKLIEILSKHPQAEVGLAVSKTFAGQFVPWCEYLKYELFELDNLKQFDVIFSCLPHGKSMSILPQLVNEDKLVIDLGADFRLPPDIFAKWYETEHLAKDTTPATYGLSEIFAEDIKKSNFIANPGCYPTSVLLALAPLLAQKTKLEDVSVFSLSGRSGAGREKAVEFAKQKGNVFSYKSPYKHQHIGEMEYIASKISHSSFKLFSFTPHVICDVNQGMYTSIVCKCGLDNVLKIYNEFYEDQPFIKISDVQDKQLNLTDAVNTNNCLIALDYNQDNKRLYIISVIDNLVKGASGQAVQNMNLALGWKQSLGLKED